MFNVWIIVAFIVKYKWGGERYIYHSPLSTFGNVCSHLAILQANWLLMGSVRAIVFIFSGGVLWLRVE